MKLMKLFAVLALVGMSNTVFGYNFTFNNKTNQVIYVYAMFHNFGVNNIEMKINPGKSSTLVNPFGEAPFYQKDLCLKKVSVLDESQWTVLQKWNDVGKICGNASFDITGVKGDLMLSSAQ